MRHEVASNPAVAVSEMPSLEVRKSRVDNHSVGAYLPYQSEETPSAVRRKWVARIGAELGMRLLPLEEAVAAADLKPGVAAATAGEFYLAVLEKD